MRIIDYQYPTTKPNIKNLAVALGYFDGVHLGHRKLLSVLIEEAKRNNLTPCVFSFADPPSKTKDTQIILYNNKDKAALFEDLGINTLVLASFDSVSYLSPQDFVDKVLIDDLSCELCVVGYNFRFGNKASGDASDLERMMKKHGKLSICVDEETVNEKTVSSTEIRTLIEERKIEEANLLLGIPYFIKGTVERGLGLGSSFGFPTVNTPIRDDSPLPSGVYRSAVRIDGKLFTGITNVGSCPTVKERDIHAETLIADFNGDLYGKEIQIYILEYLREEKKFDSIDDLRSRIYLDRDISINKNGDLKWLATGLNLQ